MVDQAATLLPFTMSQMSVNFLFPFLKWQQTTSYWTKFRYSWRFLLQKHKTINRIEDFEVKLPQKNPCKTFSPPLWSLFDPVFLPCREGEGKRLNKSYSLLMDWNIFQLHYALPRPALICPPASAEVLGPPSGSLRWNPPEPSPPPLPPAADSGISGGAPSNHRLLPPHLRSVDSRHGRSLRLFWERPLKGVEEKPTPYFTIRTCRGNNHLRWQDATKLFFMILFPLYFFEADESLGTAGAASQTHVTVVELSLGKGLSSAHWFSHPTVHHCHLYPG